MKNLSIGLYWGKIIALVSALGSALEYLPASPFVGIILYFILDEASQLAMSVAIANGEIEDGSDSY